MLNGRQTGENIDGLERFCFVLRIVGLAATNNQSAKVTTVEKDDRVFEEVGQRLRSVQRLRRAKAREPKTTSARIPYVASSLE